MRPEFKEKAMNTLVSAVIPTRNRTQLVSRAVQSALRQTYTNVEVIVVIDGPDPATAEVLNTIKEPRLRIIALQENVGVSEARNIGVQEAKGEWIGFLDDDDEWLPERVMKQVALLSSVNPDTNFIAGRSREEKSGINRARPPRFPGPQEDWSEYIYCHYNFLLTCSWLIRKTLMLELPLAKGVSHSEDVIWLLQARTANLIIPAWVDDVVAVYHNENHGGTRLSRNADWESSYQWAIASRDKLLTKKAFSYCLARVCLPRALRTERPIRHLLHLFISAVSMGEIDLRFCVCFAAYAFLTEGLRKKMWGCYESVRDKLV